VAKAMADQESEDVQRRTTKRKATLVISIIKGETGIREAARQRGQTVAEIEDWQERFFLGAENAIRARPKDRRGPQRQSREAGVHHSLHARAEWYHREVLPQPEEECVWQHSLRRFAGAKAAIRQWIEWYNVGRPHQSVGYKSPREYRAHLRESVA
jgi:hypothetical protein